MQRGTNLGRLGGFNQAVVLEAVRHHPQGISRVELAEMTGLSPQTISNVARRLLDGGWIRETGTVISGPGKPRTILELIPDRYVTVGVHVDPSQLVFTLVDLNGEVLSRRWIVPPKACDPESTVEAIGDQIESIIEDSGYPHANILGVGIAAPGPIDLEHGRMMNPPLMTGWDEVDIVEPLMSRLNMEVILSKDTVAAASAEQWLGYGANLRDFVCVYVGVGVGIGLVLDGQIMQGQTGNTGELGHVNTGVVRDRNCPVCGRNDCLAVNLNFRTIVERGKANGVDIANVDDSDLSAQLETARDILLAAQEGNEGAREIGLELADIVARAVAQVTSLVDVDQVIVCGPVWDMLRDFAEEPVTKIIEGSFHGTLSRSMTVRSSEMGGWICAIGGACVVLDELVSPKTSGLLLV